MERQLDPRPSRPRRRTGWSAPTSTCWRCRRPSAPTSSSRTMPFLAAGYEVGARAGFNQWNGVAIASRVGHRRRTGRLRRPADVERQARGGSRGGGARARVRRAAGCGCGACMCPTAASSVHRTTCTSWNGLPRCAIRRRSGSTDDPDGADRAGRRLEHRTDRRGRVERRGLRGQHPRRRARAGGVRRDDWTPNSRMWYGLSPRARLSTRTGTTRSCGSRRTAECASTSFSAHRRWRSA